MDFSPSFVRITIGKFQLTAIDGADQRDSLLGKGEAGRSETLLT